jgi:hypothetical protein
MKAKCYEPKEDPMMKTPKVSAMTDIKIIEAYQVPRGNVSPDIFALPCVELAYKHQGQTWYDVNCCDKKMIALPTRWICKTSTGTWLVLNDDEYLKITNQK